MSVGPFYIAKILTKSSISLKSLPDEIFSCKLYVTTLQHCKILPAFCNLIRWQQVTFFKYTCFLARKRMKKLIDKGEE